MELRIGLIGTFFLWSLGNPYNVGVAAAVGQIRWYSSGLMAPLDFKQLRNLQNFTKLSKLLSL